MGHHALAEKRALAFVGAIHKLVDQDECARRQILSKRAAGRQRDQIVDAGPLEDIDIGPVVDVGRRQTVSLIVTLNKNDRQPADITDAQCAGWLAPRTFDALLAHIHKSRQVVDA